MNVIKLFINLIKNFEMIKSERIKSKKFFIILEILTFILIFIPIAIFIFYISYSMTKSLENINGYLIILILLTIFSFLFSFNLLNINLYHSNDLKNLLSLPIKNEDIALAKVLEVIYTETMIISLFLLSATLGYLIGIKATFLSYINALFINVTFLILPIFLISIILLFLNCFKNKIIKKTIIKLINIISIIFIIFLLITLIKGSISIDSLINYLNLDILNNIKYIFNVYLIGKSFNNAIYLLIYMLINILAIIIFYILSKYLYRRGIIFENSNLKVNSNIKYKSLNINKSILKREFIKLFKTPSYFSNCVVINFIWPIFLVILIVLFNKINDINLLISNKKLVFVIITMISILITSANSIASSSISREGEELKIIKSLPIKTDNLIFIKSLSSIIISYSCLFIYIIIYSIYFSDNFILLYLLISLLGVIMSSNLGVLIDLINPKLIYDSEINALRGNKTVFFNMFLNMIISIFVLLMYNINIIFTFIFLIILNIIIFIIIKKYSKMLLNRL